MKTVRNGVLLYTRQMFHPVPDSKWRHLNFGGCHTGHQLSEISSYRSSFLAIESRLLLPDHEPWVLLGTHYGTKANDHFPLGATICGTHSNSVFFSPIWNGK